MENGQVELHATYSYTLLKSVELHCKWSSIYTVPVITLGAHAQRGYGSWVCVSVCMCVSVT